jgi:hypothetical protein
MTSAHVEDCTSVYPTITRTVVCGGRCGWVATYIPSNAWQRHKQRLGCGMLASAVSVVDCVWAVKRGLSRRFILIFLACALQATVAFYVLGTVRFFFVLSTGNAWKRAVEACSVLRTGGLRVGEIEIVADF